MNWDARLRDFEAVEVDALSTSEFETFKYDVIRALSEEGRSEEQTARLAAVSRRTIARMKREKQALSLLLKRNDKLIRRRRARR
jgi:hypothetical protein